MSLTPRPNHDVQRSSSALVVPSGPRPHIRPNAVASSSRISIKVEPSPSSSSASPASDIHRWGESEPVSGTNTESEHEMENDTPTIRGSVFPSRLPAPASSGALRKRPRESESTPRPKRHKDHRAITDVKHELEEFAGPSRLSESSSASRVDSGIDSPNPKQSAPEMSIGSASSDRPNSSGQGQKDGDIEMHPVDDDDERHAVDGPRNELRHRWMKRLREAAAIHAPASIEDVPEQFEIRERYLAAETDDAKLDIFHHHRILACRKALKVLRNYGCVDLQRSDIDGQPPESLSGELPCMV
jgi:hypothetical protein